MSDLDDLVVDLSRAGLRAGVKAAAVTKTHVEAAADEARKTAPRRRLPHYAKAITAEVKIESGRVVGEFGPVKGGQGSLGHILEFGSAVSPPHPHLLPAVERQWPLYAAELGRKIDPLDG